ncbi:MAG TPA: DUF2934 domain-containing protein [Steroidobacteraceae bacterium]|nr:DUF2934 domain-containing protein [Steroidobacteraceae bacterium]
MATRRSNPSRRIGESAVPESSVQTSRAVGAGSSAPSSEAPPVRRAATATRTAAAPAPPHVSVSADARRGMIAKAAYLRAERRGFVPGFEDEDWLAAEKEVDALLSAGRGVPQ